MSRAVVLVPLGVDAERHAGDLRAVARATGATLAFLHAGTPALTDELDRLAARGVTEVELVGLGLGAPTSRSWLRRVAGDWVRRHPGISVVVADRPVTGAEAPLTSPAWEEVPRHARQVLVCRGPRCSARGSAGTAAALGEELRRHGLGDDDVLVTMTGCLFPCNQAPVVVVHPDDAWYGAVDPSCVRRIVGDHLVGDSPVPGHLLARSPSPSSPAPTTSAPSSIPPSTSLG